MKIRQIDLQEAGKAAELLSETFNDDKGIISLLGKNSRRYRIRRYSWFLATINMLVVNKQPVLGAFKGDELEGVAVMSHSGFKPTAFSFITWIFSVFFSCGIRAIFKTALHDRKRRKYFAVKDHFVVEFIAVAPHMQGKGVSKALFKTLQQHAEAKKLPIGLETTKTVNIKIFEKVGFSLVGSYSDSNVAYFVMMSFR